VTLSKKQIDHLVEGAVENVLVQEAGTGGIEDIGWYEACKQAKWPDQCEWVKKTLSMDDVYKIVRSTPHPSGKGNLEPPGKNRPYKQTIVGALDNNHPMRRKYNRWYRWWMQQVKLGKTTGRKFKPGEPKPVLTPAPRGEDPGIQPTRPGSVMTPMMRGMGLDKRKFTCADKPMQNKCPIGRGIVKGHFFQIKAAISKVKTSAGPGIWARAGEGMFDLGGSGPEDPQDPRPSSDPKYYHPGKGHSGRPGGQSGVRPSKLPSVWKHIFIAGDVLRGSPDFYNAIKSAAIFLNGPSGPSAWDRFNAGLGSGRSDRKHNRERSMIQKMLKSGLVNWNLETNADKLIRLVAVGAFDAAINWARYLLLVKSKGKTYGWYRKRAKATIQTQYAKSIGKRGRSMQEPIRVPGVRIGAADVSDNPPGSGWAPYKARIDTPKSPIRENNMKLTKKQLELMILDELSNVLLEGDVSREKRMQQQDQEKVNLEKDYAGEWQAPTSAPDPTQDASPKQLIDQAKSLITKLTQSTQASAQGRNMNYSPSRATKEALEKLSSLLDELSEYIGGEGDDWHDEEHETMADRKWADNPENPLHKGKEQDDTFSADKERFMAP
tara:strand:+ start:1871 stop:3685 length:1815 start_codon:yes stop_codon:yes gene_type:complete